MLAKVLASSGSNNLWSLGCRDGKVKCDGGALLPRGDVDVSRSALVVGGIGSVVRGRGQEARFLELG